MSAPRWIHVLAADSGLAEGHRYGKYRALCGELLVDSELPRAECSEDCDREVAYCLECLRAANERNWDTGVDVDCPPGVIVRMER